MFGKNAICFTGHRTIQGKYLNMSNMTPEWALVHDSLIHFCQRAYNNGWKEFVVGGALGIDMMAGLVIIELITRFHCDDIKLHLCIPHNGYNKRWISQQNRDELAYIKSFAVNGGYVLNNDPVFQIYMLHRRNEFMVDKSRLTCGVWDGRTAKSGTYSCLQYARNHSDNKLIATLNPLITNELGFCKETWGLK